MSYQVLARKWRPNNFRELVGQEHVMQALINALDNQRLHHAYLFTGTRGVGKTTIARIFAKCLNCEPGITSTPCGDCSACLEISQGRFVDLIEVDAASRTKVEDTREILDNVQYAPARGRYKIYLIDEVHMLSNHSFNALLKTLEEPPEHVKFLLATTDPQKLPVTILSRCLQFNLKNMSAERIVHHLSSVLEQEQVPSSEAALWLMARSANGSMRDALSLTDQAIAFGNGKISEQDVASMLGTIDQRQIEKLLDALIRSDGAAVLANIAALAEFSPDYDSALAELITLLHRVAIAQAVPEALDNSQGDKQEIIEFAHRLRPEDVQLFYQTAIIGRRDLSLSPDLRAGFEMVLLRMLAFRPHTSTAQLPSEIPQGNQPEGNQPEGNQPQVASQLPNESSSEAHPAGTVSSEISGGPETGKKSLIEGAVKSELPSPSMNSVDPVTKELEVNPLPVEGKVITEGKVIGQPKQENSSGQPSENSQIQSILQPEPPYVEPVTEAVSQTSPEDNSFDANLHTSDSLTNVTPIAPPMDDEDVNQIAQAMVGSYDDGYANPGDRHTEVDKSTKTERNTNIEINTKIEKNTEKDRAAQSAPVKAAAPCDTSVNEFARLEPAPVDECAAEQSTQEQAGYHALNTVSPGALPDFHAHVAHDRLDQDNLAQGDQTKDSSVQGNPVQGNPIQDKVLQERIEFDQLDGKRWLIVFEQLSLKGVLRNTAANCVLVDKQDKTLSFILDKERSSLFDSGYEKRLENDLSQYFSCQLKITITQDMIPSTMETPAMIYGRWRQNQLETAVQDIKSNSVIQALQSSFDAQVKLDDVKLTEDYRGAL